MKQLGVMFFLFIFLVLSACGGGSSNASDTLTGNWTANLTNTDGTPAFAFTTSFTQSGTIITGTNLTITTSTGCFTSAATETGSFVLSGNFNGNLSGSLQLTITSSTPSDDTLTLQGSVNNNAISGGWTLAGLTPGCTGEGNFTFTRIS